MKKIRYIIFSLMVLFIGIGMTNAASLKVTTNKSTVVVGNTVTITVNASGAAGWEYCLKYDTNIFTLTSATSDTGGTCVKTGSSLIGYSKVTYKLKAKKSGSSVITLKNAAMYNDEGNQIASSVGSITVKAKTQAEIEASYSTNANLSALRVVDHVISPDFNKDKLEYTLEVENDVEKIEIKATKADSSATVSGTGEKSLSEGINKFNIVVTAEKGNKKTYVINVTRKELNPINVDVDGFKYTVVRKADVMEAPTYYTSTEVEIDGEKVPAFSSDITGYTLVGLKDEEGNIDLYSYTDEGYSLYKQVNSEGLVFIPTKVDKVLEGYEQSKNIDINNVNVKVYITDVEEYVLVYGMNASNGKSDWYKYDTLEGTFQRYKENTVVEEKEDKDIYFLLTIVFGGIAGISILLVILLISKNSKIRKKNDKLITMLQALREARRDKENKAESVEKRKEEEIKKKETTEELRKKQEEFLETGENEIIEDDVELEDTTPVKKNKKVRKKKES